MDELGAPCSFWESGPSQLQEAPSLVPKKGFHHGRVPIWKTEQPPILEFKWKVWQPQHSPLPLTANGWGKMVAQLLRSPGKGETWKGYFCLLKLSENTCEVSSWVELALCCCFSPRSSSNIPMSEEQLCQIQCQELEEMKGTWRSAHPGVWSPDQTSASVSEMQILGPCPRPVESEALG